MSALLPLCVACPFVAALIVLVAGRWLGRASCWIVAAAAAASTGLVVQLLGHAVSPLRHVSPWMPALGIDWAFRGDGFGLLLALLVAGIGFLVSVYAVGYLAGEDDARVRRFAAALATFMGAMLGVALADDLILLFVFWELTSVASFLLIGFYFEKPEAKAGALMALQVTAMGGLAMSVGFLLIGQITGTFSLSGITSDATALARLRTDPLATPALLCVLLGAFTKSAQVPFHFWLPRAMVAPTPVSTYLHAATMVKAGVFLLGRMHPLFGASPWWGPLLVSVGAVTMLLGAYQAFFEIDLKAILARTTGSALGMITVLYGLGATTEDSLHLLNHALYKGALFLVAGIVEHHAHTRRLDELGGLRHALPVAFVACAIASLSMAGFPPLLGFVAKDAFYAQVLQAPFLTARPGWQLAVLCMSLASSAFLVAVAGRLTLGVFGGSPAAARHDAHPHHTPGLPLWLAPLLLATTALLLGVASLSDVVQHAVNGTASDPTGHPHVALIPPLGAPLLASLTALGLGGLLYLRRDVATAWHAKRPRLPQAAAAWDAIIHAIVASGTTFSSRWQNGSLRWYLAATTLVVPALVWAACQQLGVSYRAIAVSLADLPWYGAALCVLLTMATVLVVRADTRLAAAMGTTAVGFLVSMLFVVYRSPDILLTQVLIETVSTIFILLVLVFMPAFPKRDLTRATQLVHAAIATAFGLCITVLLLLVMTPGFRATDNISNRPGGLLSLSLAEGGGANAVNVIIVDIRAMDTTGEITVLVTVGLCIFSLLRARRRET